ncbi:hypothetical protein CL619_05065 [archaeon]|nr:hypothetical protein [archaeon]
MVETKSINELAQIKQGEVYFVTDRRSERNDQGPALLWDKIGAEEGVENSMYRFISPSKTLLPGHIDEIIARENQVRIVEGQIHLVLGDADSKHYGSMVFGYPAMREALESKGFEF